jgi:hypothetical protein
MEDFQQYLYRNYDGQGIYAFKLYITKATDGFCDFYIHPDKLDGEEADFRVKADTVFSGPDVLQNSVIR